MLQSIGLFVAGDRAGTGSSLWRPWPAPALVLVQNLQHFFPLSPLSLVMPGPGLESEELSLHSNRNE